MVQGSSSYCNKKCVFFPGEPEKRADDYAGWRSTCHQVVKIIWPDCAGANEECYLHRHVPNEHGIIEFSSQYVCETVYHCSGSNSTNSVFKHHLWEGRTCFCFQGSKQFKCLIIAGTFIWCCSNETYKDDYLTKTNKFPTLFLIWGCISFKEHGVMAIITS